MKPQAKFVKVICNQRLPIRAASDKNILFYLCKSKSKSADQVLQGLLVPLILKDRLSHHKMKVISDH